MNRTISIHTDHFAAMLGLLLFGAMLGYVIGLGQSYAAMKELADRKFEITGNVHIYQPDTGEAIQVRGVSACNEETIRVSSWVNFYGDKE